MRTQKIALSGLIVCLTLSGIALSGSGCAGNRYERSTGAYIDDKGISTRVKTALFRDPAVSGFDVNVTTFRGEVQLSGYVDTAEQKERAETITWTVDGVQMVKNNLEIKPSPTAVGTPGSTISGSSQRVDEPATERPAADSPGTLDEPGDLAEPPPTNLDKEPAPPLDEPTTPTRTAPDLDLRMTQSNLEINAADGKATLRGTVSSEYQKDEIERKVREIPGIREIDNQLEVQAPR